MQILREGFLLLIGDVWASTIDLLDEKFSLENRTEIIDWVR